MNFNAIETKKKKPDDGNLVWGMKLNEASCLSLIFKFNNK